MYTVEEFFDTHMVQSTVTEREAREGILRDIAGEWNECTPLVLVELNLFLNYCIFFFFCFNKKE